MYELHDKICKRFPRFVKYGWNFRPTKNLADTVQLEQYLCSLANYCGKIVPHRVINGSGVTEQGCCLKESYVINLLNEVGVSGFSITTMGQNNWVNHRFRSDELHALATATPEQRCRAILKTVQMEDAP